MTKKETWLALGVVAIGLPILALAGFITYVNTRPPLHSDSSAVSSVTQSAPMPRWAAAVDEGRKIARAEIVSQNVPGVSVAVGIGGEIVWAEGFGLADLESRAPVTPETRFRIGHVSVPLTAAGVGLLLESGQLHLEETIQTYVPSFPPKRWPVTLRQLMAHVAGIHHYRDDEWGDKPTMHCDRAAEGVPVFAEDPLMFEPDSQFRYSTYGWVLVSAAIERAAGVSFDEFMRAKVFEPVDMSRTTIDAPKKPLPGRATSYFRRMESEVTSGVDYSCFAGGGAFLSTPSDLVRFGMAVNGGKLLKPDTVRTLQSRQQLISGDDTAYGLGWNVDTVELAGQQTRMASHASRTIEGASTSFLTFPDRGIVVAVTSNLSFAAMRSISWSVAEAFAKPLRSGS